MKRIRLSLVSLLTSILICSTNVLAQYPTLKYTLVDLGLMGGVKTVATGVNNKGQVVGDVIYADGHQDCFLLTLFVSVVKWSSNTGSRGQLPYCTANAINQNGEVAGSIYVKTGPGSYALHAFRRTASGAIVDLPPLYGGSSEGVALNDSGIVVGTSYVNSIYPAGARWDTAGHGTDLGNLGFPQTHANSINAYGVIVGSSVGYDTAGTWGIWGFMWVNGSMVALPPLSVPTNYGDGDSAYRIGSGSTFLIAGTAQTVLGEMHAVEWGAGWHVDLGLVIVGFPGPDITGLSNDNWLLGDRPASPGLVFINSPACTGLYEVSNLLDSSANGWWLKTGLGMNDSHWIVGSAVTGSGEHAVLLYPNSSPLCVSL